ncbi:MAG: ABC transporter substrate-binding protein [Pseudomonadales bacterium]|nr:hypothetical protein [Pseudomonadales bacterium]MCP5215058.1 ABC transporter substrate-binding protein [Pseudomonadales bacterium]
MRLVYIGIDDTDNLETRGTGFRARQLIERLQECRLGEGIGVTRHQLLFDERVPYTSHNSAACLVVSSHSEIVQLADCCREFLLEIAAPGSDVGLCISEEQQASWVSDFGSRAQTDVVSQQDAHSLARQYGILLEGLTGDHQGIIGALSAVGLHASGNDGRYIWGRGLRDYDNQTLAMGVLKANTNIDRVTLLNGVEVADEHALIDLGSWPRTVRINRQAVLLVEKLCGGKYKVLDKAVIKSAYP